MLHSKGKRLDTFKYWQRKNIERRQRLEHEAKEDREDREYRKKLIEACYRSMPRNDKVMIDKNYNKLPFPINLISTSLSYLLSFIIICVSIISTYPLSILLSCLVLILVSCLVN